ncbi:MAG TPA: TlpA disulfide reductase family protein [Ktedonosporobacter sp.]|nr:TlpA disulfide reductase family protein [Ktedonosporobacter sp.]
MENLLLVSSILVWIVVIANLVLTLALIRRINASPDPMAGIETGLPVGTPAPDFSAKTLEGQTVTLADSIGHPITFVFVATHCEPCHALLPTLKTLAPQARAAGTTLVLVSDGSQQETEKMMQEVAGQVVIVVAPRHEHSLFNDYQINMTPSYCALDEKGVVVAAGHPDRTNQEWQKLLTSWSKQAATADTRR